MGISDRMAKKEFRVGLLRDTIDLLEDIPTMDPKYIQKYRDKLNELRKSIEHDREVQKIGAAKSGRETWWEDAWIYFIMFFGGMAFIKIYEKIKYDTHVES